MKKFAGVFFCATLLMSSVWFATDKVASGQENVLSVGSCKIVLEGRCGDFGRKASVQNTDTTRAVIATIQVRWTKGGEKGSYQKVIAVPAGGKAYVGCTDGGGFPRKSNSFDVVGCQK